MRKPEQLLWDAMKRNLPKDLDLQRVENLVGEGMPDVYVGRSGKWVELKAPPRIPARANTPLLGDRWGLRTSQKNWHIKHHSHRGSKDRPSYVLIRIAATGELMLIHGCVAESINQLSYGLLKAGFVIANDWRQIAQELS